MLTNGTDEAIQVLINTFVDDGDDVSLLKPSYAMYRFYAEVAGAPVREIDYPATICRFPLDELLDAITPEDQGHPDRESQQPDRHRHRSRRHSPDSRSSAARRRADRRSVLRILRRHRAAAGSANITNLFVSRTFSKVYGMAAMRCGCLFSSRRKMSTGCTKRSRLTA